MRLHFYLEGAAVTPALYDYSMDRDGVLWPSKRPGQGVSGKMYVILEVNGEIPTRGQLATIQTIKTINPDWELSFFFEIDPPI